MKTKEVRGRELFVLVHGKQSSFAFDALNPSVKRGWYRLGKAVLATETKWQEAKWKYDSLCK